MHRLLILIVLFAAGCSSSSKNNTPNPEKEAGVKKTELTASTPEEFAQSVVTLLAANDPNQFVGFAYLAKEELLALVPKMVSLDRLDQVTDQIETGFDRQQKANRDCFAKVRNELAGDGCDWNQTQFVRAEYEIRKQKEISGTHIGVTLSAGSQTYKFVLPDCILVNGRWYTLDNLQSARNEREQPAEAKHDGHGEEAAHDHDPEEGSKKD